MPVDHQTFVELTTRNQNRIYRFILALVPNYSLAEDLHQQTVLTLWEKWESYDADEPFLPWAFGIARNHVLNQRRKTTRRGPSLPLSESDINRISDCEMRQAEFLDLRRDALAECVGELPNEHQEVIDAYYSKSQSADSIAEKQGRTLDSLYKSLQRIRAILFECVNRKMAAQTVLGQ